ncbi:MAG: PAS domain S-box protein [Campylobacterales bacterium]
MRIPSLPTLDKRYISLPLFFASLFFVVAMWIVGYSYMLLDKNEHIRIFLERQTERQRVAWDTISNMNGIGITAYFDTHVQKPEVGRLLDVSNYGNEQEKSEARAALYKLLLPVYYKLWTKNVRQFHFQDKQNNSFLRFHSPELYGDSLNATRPSIVAANKYNKAVFGFESGKIALSFRNVFPIEYNGKHVGSVDIGQPFDALKEELAKLYEENEYVLAVKSEQALPKLFDKNKISYITVNLGGKWIIENTAKHQNKEKGISSHTQRLINSLGTNQDAKDSIERGVATSYAMEDEGVKYVATIIPIADTESKYTSLLLSFVKAPELDSIEESLLRQAVYFSFVLLALFVALLWISYIRKKMNAVKNKLATVTQTMGEGLYILDAEGKIEYINKSAQSILGFSGDECMGQASHYLFHHHGKNGNMDIKDCPIYNAIKKGEKYAGIDYFARKNGDIFAADIIASPLWEDGVLIGSVTVFRDITDRIKLEESLRILNGQLEQKAQSEMSKRVESEKTFGTVFEKSPEGMIIISSKGEFLECNPAAAKMLGYGADELRGKTNADISPDIQPEYGLFSENASKMFFEQVMRGQTQYYEWTYITKYDAQKLMEVMLAPMVWHEQDVILCTWKDITELKKLQREREAAQAFIIQQNKLAEMGAMIGAIAHQWKQPLNAIWLMIQDVKMGYDFGDLTKESMEKFKKDAGEQVSFMNQTIEDFRSFYKPSTSKTVFTLKRAVNAVISIIKKQLDKEGIALSVNVDDDIMISGFESEFKQVILNIVNNAKDALASKDIKQKMIHIEASRQNENVLIKISDNAGGIDEQILSSNKLFEPYFSTKGEHGTGIGLSLSKTIIEKKMGGKLSAANGESGAEFSIELAEFTPEE